MNNIEKIKQELDNLEFDSSEGVPVVRLGVVVTLYFRNGYTPEVIERIAGCFKRFSEEFEGSLRGMYYKRYKKYTRKSLESALSAITEKPSRFALHLSSASSAYDVGVYSLAVLNTHEEHGDTFRSYIKMTVPWEALGTPDGVERFQAWVLYLSEQVSAEHGYGGLSTLLPFDFDRYMPIEYELSQKYPGLEVDTMALAHSLRLVGSIKGVNWFTIVSRILLERLGGLDSVRRKLSSQGGIHCLEYGGGLIVRAGALPELGSVTEVPKLYVAANRILKPLRSPDPFSLQSYSEYGNGYDKERSLRWYARFDEEEPAAQSPKKIAAGDTCTDTGFWFSPAQENSRRFFNAGEVMPEFKGSPWGATFWYWSGEE
ncbi:type VI immunity family protein [Pseudomonas sp. NPDC089406]|uniref:type VI immunity family protein n=1 Tax=Pseudomonas sp. NPDC089406 TaxID=3364463 RepID=UPI00384E781B